ncbi:MAG: hypothetical protein AAFQ83_25020 [Bacteroidota bacterium]
MKKTQSKPNPKAKNFLLFFYEFEYPKGGMKDFAGAYATEKQAHKAAREIMKRLAQEYGEKPEEVEAIYHILHLKSRRVISPSGNKTPLRSIKTQGIY